MSCKIYSEVFVDTTHFYIYVKESGIMSLKLKLPPSAHFHKIKESMLALPPAFKLNHET